LYFNFKQDMRGRVFDSDLGVKDWVEN
jgi:hypothetical protein